MFSLFYIIYLLHPQKCQQQILYGFCIECICAKGGGYVFMPKAFHYCFGVYTVFCQYRTMCMAKSCNLIASIYCIIFLIFEIN